jgi:hypothetical protein
VAIFLNRPMPSELLKVKIQIGDFLRVLATPGTFNIKINKYIGNVPCPNY